jgi:succinate dehydrogenase / fumarate reductase, iron-sulfur subunit
METISAPIEVYRYDPARDREPRYSHYDLTLPPHTPVLSALLEIRGRLDPTLTLRYSCRSAICGSCAMVINSKSRLACQTQIGPEIARHGKIVVDPMRNMAVVRDLVTEMRPFWSHYKRIEPHLVADINHPMPEGKPTAMTPAQVERFHETPRCIACASCYSACPAVEADPSFPGPMALAKLYRFVVDPRDGGTKDRLRKVQIEGLWLCMRCHLCTESCPKGVRPSERIMDLKELAIAEIGPTEAGSRHAIGFKENIRKAGLLNEMKLVQQTSGLAGLAGQVGQGLRLVRKKPEIARGPKTIEKKAEVDKIYEALDKPEEP